jgi:hypothetical protein
LGSIGPAWPDAVTFGACGRRDRSRGLDSSGCNHGLTGWRWLRREHERTSQGIGIEIGCEDGKAACAGDQPEGAKDEPERELPAQTMRREETIELGE